MEFTRNDSYHTLDCGCRILASSNEEEKQSCYGSDLKKALALKHCALCRYCWAMIGLRALEARYTRNCAINDTPSSMISHDQNWNQPVCVPANRKTFATNAPPSQKTKFPIVSAIRRILECAQNLAARMTICSIAIPMKKFITPVKKARWSAGCAGATKLNVELEFGMGYVTVVRSPKNEFICST